MLSPGDVERWDLGALTTWTGKLSESRSTLMEQLDGARRHFDEVRHDWQGAAYEAAYNRVGQDHDQGKKLGYEIDELIDILTRGVSAVAGFRDTLLAKLNDARATQLVVDDTWKVLDREGVDPEVIRIHQDAINAAFPPFRDAVENLAKQIGDQALEIRSGGDLLGSSLDVADADNQATRFGKQDGKALADAARNGDPATIDEIASNMPEHVLSPDELRRLAAGEEVSTVPASVQDYYKALYQEAGKDGILALNQRLLEREQAGDPVAAMKRDNLANSLMVVSNEKIGSGPKRGSYADLPPGVRELVSGRYEDRDDAAIDGQRPVKEQMLQQAAFAELLTQANPGYEPGQTLGIELGRQSASLAEYVESSEKDWHGYPPGFDEGDLDKVEAASRQFLETSTRNNESSYALLTGKDPNTGQDIPGDLSFGATDKQYNPQDFDPQKFTSTVFSHEWDDDGKTAAGLYEWIADGTDKPDPEGLLAKRALAELPNIFAPEETDDSGRPKLKAGEDGTIFEDNAKAFVTNPKLADGLSHVLATNIETYVSPKTPETKIFDDPLMPGDQANVAFRETEANRLLFLGSQSETGRFNLEFARQAYEAEMLDRAVTEGGGDPQRWLSIHASELGSLDGRITNASLNALTYQQEKASDDDFKAKQETYEMRQRVGDIVKSLTLDSLEIPGATPVSVIGNQVLEVAKEEGYNAAMEKFNPEPEKEYPTYPDRSQASAVANQQIVQQLFNTLHANGQLPPEFFGPDGRPLDVAPFMAHPLQPTLRQFLTDRNLAEFTDNYADAHSFTTLSGMASKPGDMTYYVTGKLPEEPAKK
ncbi:TPR repeat region-containing protein [Nocardia sp. R6R-6]|uniref:TPR repeat region-containing protein n=1 Tax=Nocardia sp. R6R-6 TaxID=3459303 RepID=UPI00403DA4E4